MTEEESSSNIKAGELDALGSSPDEAPASPQKVNESINEKTGIELENATEGAAADLTLEESESASGGHQSSISSANDAEVSEAVGSSNVGGTHESENNQVDLGDASEISYEKVPENDKEITKSSAVDDAVLVADNTAVEQHLSSGNDEVSNLSHENPSENTIEDANEITNSEEEKVFPEADPTESTEVAAHQEDEQLSSSEYNDTDLAIGVTLENHAIDQDPHVSIKEIIPETVSIDLAEKPSSPEHEHESLRNLHTILQPTVETPIGTLESEEDVSLNKEASASENAVDRDAEDPPNEEADANGEVHPIGDKETSTAIHEGAEGALKPEDSIPDDAVIRRPLHDTAENSYADELNVSSSEMEAKIPDDHPTGSIEAAEKQEVEEETGAQGSPVPWDDDLSEKDSPNEQDITLIKEVADEGNISPNAEALESENISFTTEMISEDRPISYEDLTKEESTSSIQDVSSYSPCDETFQRADSVAASEVGEQQESKSDSCEEHAIDTEADKPAISQVDASVLSDGQYNRDAEDSQETHLTVGAEAKDEQESAVDSRADYENSKENTVPHEASYYAISKENTVPHEASCEREFSDDTQQEVLADLGAGSPISDDAVDSVLSHREFSEKDLPVQIGFTSPNQEVQGYEEVNQTGRADEVEEPKDQSDIIVELPSLEKTLVSDSPEVSEESLMNDKEIEQAESKYSAGDVAIDPDSCKTFEDADKVLSSEDDRPEEIVGNEQNITRSSNEAVASKEDTIDSTDCDVLDKRNDNLSMQEHEDLGCNKENDDGAVKLTGVSADSPAFQNPEEQILFQSKELDMENGYFSDEKHPAIIEQDGSADQFESERKNEDVKTCADTDNIENFGKAEVEERSGPADSEAALSEDSTTMSFVDIAKECGVSQAAASDEHLLHLTDVTAKDHNSDDVVPSETESADKDLSVVQKDEENVSLPETEAHASIDPTSVTIASPSEIQELEGQNELAFSDNAATNEADAQETFSTSDSEKETTVLEAVSSIHAETPIAQQFDESESHEALRSITTDQEGGSTDEKFAQLESDEVLALPNGTDKSFDLTSIQEKLKDSKENEIEVKEVGIPSSHLKIDSSDTSGGIAAVLGNVPVLPQNLTSDPVKEFAEGHEQMPEQGDEAVTIGQGMEEGQDLQNVPGCNLWSSSIPSFESGQGDEISGEQPFGAQNSLPDLNDQKIQEKLLEGVEVLSPEDEIKNQVKSSTEFSDHSISGFANTIDDHSNEIKVKQSEATDIPSAYKQQTDILNPATVEQSATLMSSDKPARVPTLPVSTYVTSFSDGRHEVLNDTKRVLTTQQGSELASTGSGNGVPKESKKELSSEKIILPSNGTTHADENLPDTALGVVSTLQHPVSSPASETKFQSQVKVEEEQTKPGISFPWSLLLCCSSKES